MLLFLYILCKREIGYFYITVMQWRQRNVLKGMMYEQSGCFAY